MRQSCIPERHDQYFLYKDTRLVSIYSGRGLGGRRLNWGGVILVTEPLVSYLT